MTMNDGREDIRRAAEELAERLPDALAPLARLAYNYRWSWLPGGPELFQSIDPERFALTSAEPGPPPPGGLERGAAARRRRRGLLERAAAVEAQVKADLDRPYYPSIDPARPVAFLCAEYGVHVSLPIYSGGLGALAGDLLKEASDCAVPLVAVGLMYRKGYFRQRIDAVGWQHEYWVDTDPQRLPAALVTGADDRPLTIEVPIYDAEVTAQIWRVDVGRIPLFLLDTDLPENGPVERWITARLYESDEHIRAGSVRAARRRRRAGADRARVRARRDPPERGPRDAGAGPARGPGAALGRGPVGRARGGARADRVHDPHAGPRRQRHLPAPSRSRTRSASLVAQLGIDSAEVIALGRTHPDDADEDFGVTQAALRMSRAANGVSRRHGEVAREMWQPLWPELAVEQVPIGYVTNGVHVPTWIGAADPRVARPPPRRGLDGARRRARHLGRASTRSPTTTCGPPASASAPTWSSRSAPAAPPSGCSAAIAATTSTRPRRRSIRAR